MHRWNRYRKARPRVAVRIEQRDADAERIHRFDADRRSRRRIGEQFLDARSNGIARVALCIHGKAS